MQPVFKIGDIVVALDNDGLHEAGIANCEGKIVQLGSSMSAGRPYDYEIVMHYGDGTTGEETWLFYASDIQPL